MKSIGQNRFLNIVFTVLSREAVANRSPSLDHAQSHIILPCDLSAATGRYPEVSQNQRYTDFEEELGTCLYLPEKIIAKTCP